MKSRAVLRQAHLRTSLAQLERLSQLVADDIAREREIITRIGRTNRMLPGVQTLVRMFEDLQDVHARWRDQVRKEARSGQVTATRT